MAKFERVEVVNIPDQFLMELMEAHSPDGYVVWENLWDELLDLYPEWLAQDIYSHLFDMDS